MGCRSPCFFFLLRYPLYQSTSALLPQSVEQSPETRLPSPRTHTDSPLHHTPQRQRAGPSTPESSQGYNELRNFSAGGIPSSPFLPAGFFVRLAFSERCRNRFTMGGFYMQYLESKLSIAVLSLRTLAPRYPAMNPDTRLLSTLSRLRLGKLCFLCHSSIQQFEFQYSKFNALIPNQLQKLTSLSRIRPLPTPRMDGPRLRVLPRPQWLYMPRPRQWPRIPDGSGLRVRYASPGERRYARLHGLPQLFRQRRHARPQRHRPGSARRPGEHSSTQGPPHLLEGQLRPQHWRTTIGPPLEQQLDRLV